MSQPLIEAWMLAGITQGRDFFDRDVLRSIASLDGLFELQVAAIDFDCAREIEQVEAHAHRMANGAPCLSSTTSPLCWVPSQWEPSSSR